MPYKDIEKRRANARKHYPKHKERIIASNKKRKAVLKQKYVEYKKTLCCEQCGESHPACLVFHHINPKEKEISVNKAITNGWAWERILGEIRKCVVLCSNCHRKLHYELK